MFGGLLIGILLPLTAAGEDFSLELTEFEKKSCTLGGFAEIKGESLHIRKDGTATLLNLHNPPSTLNRLTTSMQLNGSYRKGIAGFNWLAAGFARQDDLGWADSLDLYEGYLTLQPKPAINAALGKKSYTWGKGYAWNLAGFINRTKDPNNPEEALEGYATVEAEWIKSFSGDLQNLAVTWVVLPVNRNLNDDFGSKSHVNLAAKLYLLYCDTDIDFIVFTGNSRTDRFGLDFSRNITTNFEIHGELAHLTDIDKPVLWEDGSISDKTDDITSALVGIRYLSRAELTSIIEYYHNGGGYSAKETALFHDLVDNAAARRINSGENALPGTIPGSSGYIRPYAGRNYLYARFSRKDPFDILYFTPAVTTIVNLDDDSLTLTPELIYTGYTNWEIRLRCAILEGNTGSDFGEKQNSSRIELRLRYFF
ncbi:hypothetical protein JCM39068_20090 [Desulfocastanea catecholica]